MTQRGSTYDAVFGYQNDNDASVVIPVGAANRFVPTPAGRGQVTEFLPGNIQEAFTVVGVPRAQVLEWVVTSGRQTAVATASATFTDACAEPPPPTGPIGIFACIVDRGSRFDVVFGYESDNRVAVSIPVGFANLVEPGRPNRGQPTLFQPGRHPSAFTVRGVPDTSLIAWTLSFEGTRRLLVTSSHPVRCAGPEPPLPVRPFPVCVVRIGATYSVIFGYSNMNRRDVIVPFGSANRLDFTPRLRGIPLRRPEVLRPGVVFGAFAVPGVKADESVTWTLVTAGRRFVARATVTSSATASRTDSRLPTSRSRRPRVRHRSRSGNASSTRFGSRTSGTSWPRVSPWWTGSSRVESNC